MGGSPAWVDAFLAREALPAEYREVIETQILPNSGTYTGVVTQTVV